MLSRVILERLFSMAAAAFLYFSNFLLIIIFKIDFCEGKM
jgi:hypothetical protein